MGSSSVDLLEVYADTTGEEILHETKLLLVELFRCNPRLANCCVYLSQSIRYRGLFLDGERNGNTHSYEIPKVQSEAIIDNTV
jgi:hypothetical protein